MPAARAPTQGAAASEAQLRSRPGAAVRPVPGVLHRTAGKRHLAPTTFFTRADASAWLAMREAEFVEHRWKPAPPPDQEKVRFGDYAEIRPAGPDLSPKDGQPLPRNPPGTARLVRRVHPGSDHARR